jgi:hypothetical protein
MGNAKPYEHSQNTRNHQQREGAVPPTSQTGVISFMSVSNPGRPPKPDAKKRKQLHISLYSEDLERLGELTDNRSDFVRQCIAKAWAEQHDEQVTFTFTLPRWLVREIAHAAEEQLPPEQAAAVQTLADGLLQ